MIRSERFLPWLLRGIWIATLVVGGAAVDDATSSRSADVAATATWSAFAVWVIGVIAMAIPGVLSLTAVRAIVPLGFTVAGVSIFAGATGPSGWALLAVTLLGTVVACSADLGRAFVQASAYGEEDRHLLRPPAAYLLASIVVWTVWAGFVMATPLLLSNGRWVIGAGSAAATAALTWFVWPRWHRLSRRWFVVVPIGIVVHDHLVLAETMMLRRQEIAAIRLAPADSDAADLTGPAGGHAIEIATTEPTTVVFAATPRDPGGRAIHLTAALVAPTRPGQALAAAAARRLPVG